MRTPEATTAGARRHRIAAMALATITVLTLAACADMSGIAPANRLDTTAPTLPAYVAGSDSQGAELVIPSDWWHAWGDEQLDRLIDRALQGSPSLQQAQARFARQRAFSEAAGVSLKPQVNAQLDVLHQRYSEHGLVPPQLAGEQVNTATAQLNFGWEIDFFGKNRAALDAALGAQRASEADALAARVLLASQIARGYLQFARLNDQLDVARRTLAQRGETLALVRSRVGAGLDSNLELRQSETILPEARQAIEALEGQRQIARHGLAALAGDLALADTIQPVSLAALPTVAAPQTVPLQLVAQRADIAAARWRIEAATQDVKSAKAQFYPNINLAAFAGLSSIGLGQLVQAGSLQWGVGPALRLPIFDAGRLRANLRGKTADLDAAVASYNGAVIDAVRDVADQLSTLGSVARQQLQQQAAQVAAESAYDIARARYQAGLSTLINVLTTETAVLNQRRLAVDLHAQALDSRVALLRALGGGLPAELPDARKNIAENDDAISAHALFRADRSVVPLSEVH
ncbi:MAG: efflux transporter outer membrane subunit [Burkholderiaceae bacterium]